MYTIIMNGGWRNFRFNVESRAKAIVLLDLLHDSFDKEASDDYATFSLIRNDKEEDNNGNDTV